MISIVAIGGSIIATTTFGIIAFLTLRSFSNRLFMAQNRRHSAEKDFTVASNANIALAKTIKQLQTQLKQNKEAAIYFEKELYKKILNSSDPDDSGDFTDQLRSFQARNQDGNDDS